MKIERKYSNGGCMKSGMTLAALIIIIIWLCITVIGCGKTKMIEWNTYDDYSLVIDWYTLDTSKLIKRTQWDYNKIYEPTVKMKFDTASDKWYIDCNMLNRQQHLYYLKNGKKIQQSKYPK